MGVRREAPSPEPRRRRGRYRRNGLPSSHNGSAEVRSEQEMLMKHVTRTALAALALFAAVSIASAAAAAPVKYAVDKPHSEIGFEVRHFFSKVPGRFGDFSGTIVFDEADPSKITVDASAVTASVTTANEKRDGHLKTADFFDAEKYPAITFKSTKVTAAGKNKYKIAGDFTMRGVTKPVVFDAEFLGAGNVAAGGQSMGVKAGFTATTVINRKDFGINWNKALDNGGMVREEVTLTLNIQANLPTPRRTRSNRTSHDNGMAGPATVPPFARFAPRA
jgi:polyisoprenoid-binding protein YceI